MVDRCYDQAVAANPLMSEEQLKAFIEKIKSDTKAATDFDAVVIIAKEAGFVISAEYFQKAQSQVGDAELENASGGFGYCAPMLAFWQETWGSCKQPEPGNYLTKYCN